MWSSHLQLSICENIYYIWVMLLSIGLGILKKKHESTRPYEFSVLESLSMCIISILCSIFYVNNVIKI